MLESNEATLMLGRTRSKQVVRVLDGAFETFLLALHKRLALPPGAEVGVAPEILLSVLERRGRWREALEVAAEHAPERVAGLLEHAGEVYLERGLYGRLWEVLAGLPESQSKTQSENQSENPSETPEDAHVLTWRLRAAKRLGHVDELRETAEAHLDAHEAPDLRALYAPTLPGARELTESARAYHAAKTPLTPQHYGNALAFRGPTRSLEMFREPVTLTERWGTSFERTTAEMVLALHPEGLNLGQLSLLYGKASPPISRRHFPKSASSSPSRARLTGWPFPTRPTL